MVSVLVEPWNTRETSVVKEITVAAIRPPTTGDITLITWRRTGDAGELEGSINVDEKDPQNLPLFNPKTDTERYRS